MLGEIAVDSFIGTPNHDMTRSVTGLCRSADGGSRSVECHDKDAARASSKPKPRTDEGLVPESTPDASNQASKVLPECVPPIMHVNMSEGRRINKTKVKERREMSHKTAIKDEKVVNMAHRGYEALHQLLE